MSYLISVSYRDQRSLQLSRDFEEIVHFPVILFFGCCSSRPRSHSACRPHCAPAAVQRAMPRALPTWAALRDSRVRKTVAGQSSLFPAEEPSLTTARTALPVTDNELLRNAYKYIRDNTQLDFRTRAAAMHKLNAMPSNVSCPLPGPRLTRPSTPADLNLSTRADDPEHGRESV